MTKLEELKAVYDAAYASWDAAWDAADVAYAAYQAELKKIREEETND